MESHLEARLWNDVFTFAAGRARHPARHGARHGAHRDHPRGVRDGRDPLRAARPRVRAERRPLGLPVQHHQVLPRRRAGVRPARPRQHHACRRRSCAPTPSCWSRPATGAGPSPWAAWRRSSPAARTRRPTSAPSPRSARTSSARPADGFDGSWVAHPDLVAGLPGGLRRRPRRPPQPARPAPLEDVHVTAERPARRRVGRRARSPRGAAQQRLGRRSPTPAAWLSGNGAVAHPQPHGGRRHRRDLPLADLAADRTTARARRHGQADHRASSSRRCSPRSTTRSARSWATPTSSATTSRPGRWIAGLCLADDLRRLPDPAGLRAGRSSMATATAGAG